MIFSITSSCKIVRISTNDSRAVKQHPQQREKRISLLPAHKPHHHQGLVMRFSLHQTNSKTASNMNSEINGGISQRLEFEYFNWNLNVEMAQEMTIFNKAFIIKDSKAVNSLVINVHHR